MRYTFREIKIPASRSWKCMETGKWKRKQTTFSQTVNPFNKNKDGNPKTGAEIHEELIEESKRWRDGTHHLLPLEARSNLTTQPQSNE